MDVIYRIICWQKLLSAASQRNYSHVAMPLHCPIPSVILTTLILLVLLNILQKRESNHFCVSARELLRISGAGQQQFGSEGVRIAEVIQNTTACATNPNDPTSRFSNYERIPDPFICPPLPPPPAPPAKACPLTKNQKY